MAQVKKFQDGGEASTKPKKRIYNGVELTDDDINQVISHIGEWGLRNANYSEDIRKWSDLATQAKNDMLNGNIPTFDPTGTSMGTNTPGKTNQNIFGNWAGESLNRQFASVLKGALDQITAKSTENKSTDTKKYHTDMSGLLSNKYFAGNWENAQKGIGEWDAETRRKEIRQGLIDIINGYKTKYGEDSPYISKLSELNNPNITNEELKKIGYFIGQDVSEYLEGTSPNNNNTENPLSQFGTIDNTSESGKFAKSKGLTLVKDKNGINRLYDGNNQEVIDGDYIENEFTDYYGYGMFRDPTTGNWNFGRKEDFVNNPAVYNKAMQAYRSYYNQNQANQQVNVIDFNGGIYSPQFSSLRSIYNPNANFEFYDLSDQFEGLGQDNRIIIPKAAAKYDALGKIDLKRSHVYIYDKKNNINRRLNIKLTPNGQTIANDNVGNIYNLGAAGTGMNTPGELNLYDTKLTIATPINMSQNDLKETVSNVVGFENGEVNKNNIKSFIYNVTNGNFRNRTDERVSNRLASTVLNYYNLYKPRFSEKELQDLQRWINRATSGKPIFNKTTSGNYNIQYTQNKKEEARKIAASRTRKDGGIIKAQVGATLVNKQKITPLLINDYTPIKKTSHEGRLRDTFKGDNTLDAIGVGLDALSLAGGAVGVGAGLASTIVQGISDSNRSGFLSGEMLTNLGINLGFTLLAAVPGLGVAKGAVKGTKIFKELKTATKLTKDIEGSKEVLTVANKLLKAADKAKDTNTLTKNLNKEISKFGLKGSIVGETFLPKNKKLENIVRAGATGARYGFGTYGLIEGGKSVYDIGRDISAGGLGSTQLEDWRGLVGGIAGGRALKSGIEKRLLKRVTTPSKVEVNANTIVKVKGIPDEFPELKNINIGKYKNAKEANEAIQKAIKPKVDELKQQLSKLEDIESNTKARTDLESKIKLLEDAKIDANWLKKQRLHAKETVKSIGNKGTSFYQNKLVNDVSNRVYNKEKLNSTGLRDWWGTKIAKKYGYLDVDKDVLKSTKSKKTYTKKEKKIKPNKTKENIILKQLSLPQGKQQLALPTASFRMPQYSQSNPINTRIMPEYTQSNPNFKPFQLSLFKQGGQLIPKFVGGKEITYKSKQYQQTQDTRYIPFGKFEQNDWRFADGKYTKDYLDFVNDEQNWNTYKNDVQKAVTNTGSKYIIKDYNDYKRLATDNKPGPIHDFIISKLSDTPEKVNTPIVTEKVNTPIVTEKVNTPIVTENKDEITTNKTLFTPDLTKRELNIDTTMLRELPKLALGLNTNEKNRQLLSSVSPALLQNPTEIYKPVLTNLINENAVKEQTTDYLRRMAIPMTSDASLQKAGMLEGLSKINPLLIQAKAENTNMYNKSLEDSINSSEKYALQRNEIANQNRQIITADQAAKARYSAGKLVADYASIGNYLDKANRSFERNQMYKKQSENAITMQNLQKEYSDKLKPFEESYNKLADYKNSTAYKNYLNYIKGSDNKKLSWEDYKEGDTSGIDLWKTEQENSYKSWKLKNEELQPYYQNLYTKLNYSNPYLTQFNYKSGGELTAQSRVEVQKLKNKLKSKELDNKYINESLNRKQKEVSLILNGLSKETFFLLKTILGK